MSMQTIQTALLRCIFGNAPSPLMVLPINKYICVMGPGANMLDSKPFLNVLPFGMCISPGNPMFIAATAAALGVPTPVPCIPMTTNPWVPPNPTVVVGTAPAISKTAMLMCNWGGLIMQQTPGEFMTKLPL